ncbi:DUF2254 domain-containing protein [Marinobacter sp. 1Y8]
MPGIESLDRLRFLVNRVRERLWVKPLFSSLLSVAAVFLAKAADYSGLGELMPVMTQNSVETLLSVMASSMLVIATLAVASMVSAYASASNTATPRSFRLIIADDVSQNALSIFIGAFIFSIVALTAAKNNYYANAGLFTLFVMTGLVFVVVVLTFVRWVDRIARLGRVGATIESVESATAAALRRHREMPRTTHSGPESDDGRAVTATGVGYVQHVDLAALQAYAEEESGSIRVLTLPGTLLMPGRVMACVSHMAKVDDARIRGAFTVGSQRRFDDDPRFGLVVLSEIASRALSSAINDPGTGIDILTRFAGLFQLWCEEPAEPDDDAPDYNRVSMPEIDVRDMFDDAFGAIARDGAEMVEVCQRLQKVLGHLAGSAHLDVRDAAVAHQRLALKYAANGLVLEEDLERVRQAGGDSLRDQA